MEHSVVSRLLGSSEQLANAISKLHLGPRADRGALQKSPTRAPRAAVFRCLEQKAQLREVLYERPRPAVASSPRLHDQESDLRTDPKQIDVC